jgi:dihydrofolate synthase/folylpolyglutamate synthase
VNYPDAVRYLLSFADFERSGRFRDRLDVAPVLVLLHRLGDPHLGRRTVHVAGSKGKGSVAAMVEAILREAGYVTGLYTSPHLHSYRERIRINGDPISVEGFVRLTAAVKRAVGEAVAEAESRSVVTFDLFTALGFLSFREADVQVQVIEVGLGGRVDSTNVFEAKDVAVITPISLEHTQILGDTVEQIAREKAAIITPGCTVVMAPQPYPNAALVIQEFAEAAGAPLVDVARGYRWRTVSQALRRQQVEIQGPGGKVRAQLALMGAHQVENAATAIACIEALREHGAFVPDESIPDGLVSARWPGRLEVLREVPLLVADGAHNRDSARRLREALRDTFSAERVVFVVGSSADGHRQRDSRGGASLRRAADHRDNGA